MPQRNVKLLNGIPDLPRAFWRVGIYCRVSNPSGAQLDSVSQQVSFLTELVASRRDWMLRDTYLDFQSGSHSKNRKAYLRMLQDCRNGKLDMIITRTMTRFGRDSVEILEQLRALKDCGVEVRFVDEELNSNDPEQEWIISLIAALAQADNDSRRENIIWGIQRKLEDKTSSIYSRPCYGYEKNSYGELLINEDQAKNVELIFDLYLSGNSVLGIIKELEKRNVPSPTNNKSWCKRSIDTMLSNEKYCGDVLVVKTYMLPNHEGKRTRNKGERQQYLAIGNHPAIISREQFKAVQEEKTRRSNIELSNGTSKRKPSKYSSKSNLQ